MLPLLDGLRIVDLTAVILGPYATQILGDLGADVIKIEPPDGDSMRHIPPLAEPGVSAIFANHNRNKRSLVLDLKTDAGRQALSRLIAGADALVHNMRQDALDRLGFGFAAAKALNPRIVYCAAVGYGSRGPYAGRPAYDDVIQAASGLAGLFEMRDDRPAFVPSIVADKVGGLHVAYAVLAALLHRERTRGGAMHVELPMFEALVSFSLSEHLAAATFEDGGRLGYHRALLKTRRPYRTRDGWIAVLPYTTAHWARALPELGGHDIAASAWFRDPAERSRRTGELYALLDATLPQRTTAEWVAVFERLDIPCSRVNLPQDLLADAHLAAVGHFAPDFDRPTPVRRTLASPVVVHGLAGRPDRPPARLGEDARAVLAEAGFSAEEISAIVRT